VECRYLEQEKKGRNIVISAFVPGVGDSSSGDVFIDAFFPTKIWSFI
jgi:hypothetical protein